MNYENLTRKLEGRFPAEYLFNLKTYINVAGLESELSEITPYKSITSITTR